VLRSSAQTSSPLPFLRIVRAREAASSSSVASRGPFSATLSLADNAARNVSHGRPRARTQAGRQAGSIRKVSMKRSDATNGNRYTWYMSAQTHTAGCSQHYTPTYLPTYPDSPLPTCSLTSLPAGLLAFGEAAREGREGKERANERARRGVVRSAAHGAPIPMGSATTPCGGACAPSFING